MMTLNLTENQWYNFICGMLAGAQLKQSDETEGIVTTDYTLGVPWAIGGEPLIGISAGSADIYVPPSDGFILLPVSINNVNLPWNGFKVVLNIKNSMFVYTNAISFVEVIPVEPFDDIIVETPSHVGDGEVVEVTFNGDPSIEYNEDAIIFYLKFRVADRVNLDTKYIDVVYTDNPDYCSYILKWAEVDEGEYGLFGVYPTSNHNGKISLKYVKEYDGPMTQSDVDYQYTELIKDIINKSASQGAASNSSQTHSPSGAYVPSGVESPPNSESSGIGGDVYINPNPNYSEQYNPIYAGLSIDKHKINTFGDADILGVFKLFKGSVSPNTNYSLDISFSFKNCSRDEFNIISVPRGENYFIIDSWEYNVEAQILHVEYHSGSVIPTSLPTDTYLFYIVYSVDANINPNFLIGLHGFLNEIEYPSNTKFNYTDGYITSVINNTSSVDRSEAYVDPGSEVYGEVFSSIDQYVQIQYNNCAPQIVHLKPGKNILSLKLPYLKSQTDFKKSYLSFKSTGYMMMPIGLKIKTKTIIPYKGLKPISRYEKCRLKDVVGVYIRSAGVFDEHINEQVNVRDTLSVENVSRRTYNETTNEQVNIRDLFNTDLIVRREYNEVENEQFEIKDNLSVEQVGPKTFRETPTEQVGLNDVVNTSVERPTNYIESHIEEVGLNDSLTVDIRQRRVIREVPQEVLNVLDVININKE